MILGERLSRLKAAGLVFAVGGLGVLFNPLGFDWSRTEVVIEDGRHHLARVALGVFAPDQQVVADLGPAVNADVVVRHHEPVVAEIEIRRRRQVNYLLAHRPRGDAHVAVGAGQLDEDGKRTPLTVKKGDRVLFSAYGGTEIKVNGEDYLILSEDEILAVIE